MKNQRILKTKKQRCLLVFLHKNLLHLPEMKFVAPLMFCYTTKLQIWSGRLTMKLLRLIRFDIDQPITKLE